MIKRTDSYIESELYLDNLEHGTIVTCQRANSNATPPKRCTIYNCKLTIIKFIYHTILVIDYLLQPPTGIQMRGINSSSVELTWNRTNNTCVSFFKIVTHKNDTLDSNYATHNTSLLITNLVPYGVYTFSIASANSEGTTGQFTTSELYNFRGEYH